MNKLYYLFMGILFITIMNSCSNEDVVPSIESHSWAEDIILQKRSTSVPKAKNMPFRAINKKQTRSYVGNNDMIGDSEILLGYSYTVGNSIVGSIENVKFPVLDLNKIKTKYSTSITRKQLNSTGNYAFSYNGMSRYETNSQVSRTVKAGFSLNLGLFKIGREKKMTELFKTSFSSESNCVYGELNLEIKGSQYELLTTAAKRKIYARECLSETFLTDLYRGTMGNLIEVYGPFVLRSYITGGKATAFYSGRSAKGTSSESKEKGLTNDINASFTWKSNSASGNLSFGKNTGSGSSSQYETQETEVYVETFGGDPAHRVIVAPQKLDNLSVDLSSWLNSLSNRNSYTIIDITSGFNEGEGGLYPLSDFVLEKNFRYRLDDTTNGFLESFGEVQDPKIEIVKVLAKTTSTGEKLYEIAAILNTRQGDKIILSDGTYLNASDSELRANNDNQTMMGKVQKIFTKKKNVLSRFNLLNELQYDI